MAVFRARDADDPGGRHELSGLDHLESIFNRVHVVQGLNVMHAFPLVFHDRTVMDTQATKHDGGDGGLRFRADGGQNPVEQIEMSIKERNQQNAMGLGLFHPVDELIRAGFAANRRIGKFQGDMQFLRDSAEGVRVLFLSAFRVEIVSRPAPPLAGLSQRFGRWKEEGGPHGSRFFRLGIAGRGSCECGLKREGSHPRAHRHHKATAVTAASGCVR